MKKITILGVTGSIGTQTLDVIRNDIENFTIVGISANTNYEKIIPIIEEFKPKYVTMMDEAASLKLKKHCMLKKYSTKILQGLEGLNYISTLPEVNIVVTAVVGMIGLVPTMKAINAGKDIALANKETLVAAGGLVMDAAKKNHVNILPVDSEHGAIFQCLQGNKSESVNKIIITASGGPFRGKNKQQLIEIKPEEALKHPKWEMGRKISIDSSTLMNKGLEVIEAHWLFGVDYENIQVVVHPQSIIHSMVEYMDASVIAQMSSADMRLPIQYAINYPERNNAVIDKLDFYNMGNLTFEKPDMDTFKCLKLAYKAGEMSGNMPAIMNAANEVAVELFLDYKIKYLIIEDIIEKCMNKFEHNINPDLEEILEIDLKVREYVRNNYDKE
ncbi:1-deoxy-D-xylulose-5-phosphate reductoisomerase [Clostridium sp. CM028]|uniref:1-deoxy-D-xylulose-5-phosphate reductoisomerase n=1 Tax=unclassified Clostridium TaxID=2614128 RepID=UPI001C6EF32A|nr:MULTISPECIES: 1-deoxy-D-xylulose-5-phosphate reductoisomerase [unclassified Clostridium]MBW9144081.1 1-deoxy-D-xylulose-5-phosphate reductoisomerase [Clostridium sp. CM027]MBW9147608.1 1-deoxy-D-xylulose-5-phosphate reductoisomerase [Clostridium sp. CM028]UVE41271.1 1-deoxy-D-xylulose-5-phosphate reductoisomerase [Clostridium sp. CM027]WLC61941.1 1-deoxy-D-xylulose-5-phosphate reductoisomerase [Clostridium sp. CM028]